MNLWIRSQNKHSLTQVNCIYVSDDDNNCEVIMATTTTGHIRLGRYKSKERTLEVLDEIQNILKPQLILKKCESVVKQEVENINLIVNPTYNEAKELSTYVYEMPNE